MKTGQGSTQETILTPAGSTQGDGSTAEGTTNGGESASGESAEAKKLAAEAAGKKDGGAETKAGEGEKAEGEKKEEPKDVELKLPEGFEPDDVHLGEFKALAKEAGLKGETAQKVLDLFAKQQTEAAKKAEAAWEQQQKAMVDAVKADQEIGGSNFKANVVHAQKAMQKFGSKELRALLTGSGLGNHPELVRFFARVGKGLSEDSIAGASGGSKTAAPKTPEEAFINLFTKNKKASKEAEE